MVVADLHVHTRNSDGTLTLADVPTEADAAGLEAVAITDHDRIHPNLDAPVTTVDGIDIIHGIELRVEIAGQRIDLLGYGVERTDSLVSLVESLQENRIERARQIVDCVESQLGVDLDVALTPGVGRPHIARAVADSDHDYGYQDAFDHLIDSAGPCYVSRDIPDFATGREILDEACAIVGLAHPLRYDDPETALEYAADLDAVELQYPYGRDVDLSIVQEAIDSRDQLPTGGSDAHETELGIAGLDEPEYRDVRAQLPELSEKSK